MKNNFYFLGFLSFFSWACTGQSDSTGSDNISIINLSDNIETVSSLPLSATAEDVDVVALETTDESLIAGVQKLQVTDHDIWIFSGRDPRVFRFSRDGKFLNHVGLGGQGPKEYRGMYDFMIDQEKQEVFIISGLSGVQVYNFEGDYVRNATRMRSDSIFASAFNRQFLLFKNFFVLGQNLALLKPLDPKKELFWSFSCIDTTFQKQERFQNPSHKGREMEIFTNRMGRRDGKMVNHWVESPNNIDTYGDQVTIKFPDTDTIYSLDLKTQSIHPSYTIIANEPKGDYGLTHQWAKERKYYNYFEITGYYPAKDHIYLVASKGDKIYTYRYDKRTGTVVQKSDQGTFSSRKLSFFPNPIMELSRPFILENDLMGGDFTVDFRSSGKYWVDVLMPFSDNNWLEVADIQGATVKDKKKQTSLIHCLENVTEESNPVLIIATLK